MSANNNEPTTDESAQKSICSLAAENLASLPVTKISHSRSSFPDAASGNQEEVFNKLYKGLETPIRIIPKKDIKLNRKDPLHFFRSLAFVLRAGSLPFVAVSSFTNFQELYVASNRSIEESEQKEITDIINSFLEMKPAKEISEKVLPRQLPYIIKKIKKITFIQMKQFSKEYPGQLSEAVTRVLDGSNSLEDIRSLIKLIWENREDLRLIKDGKGKGKTSEETEQEGFQSMKRLAYHLCKMVRYFEEICFILKKVKRHQADKALQSVSVQFINNENKCHAEVAILHTAFYNCASETLYIGVSKRPCYCCSLLFKAVKERQRVKFNVSIVTTHGKVYGLEQN